MKYFFRPVTVFYITQVHPIGASRVRSSGPHILASRYVSLIDASVIPSPLFDPGSPIPQISSLPPPPPKILRSNPNPLPMVQISEARPEYTNNPPDPNPKPNPDPIEEPAETTIDDERKQVEPATSVGTGGVQCPAGMEVVRTDDSRWTVSKVVLKHSHDDLLSLEEGLTAGLLPAAGMEFDSVSAAKTYYSAYGEKLGFKVKMGNGKRSQGSRILLMQGFICEKGKSDESEIVRKKRGTCKKRDQNDIDLDMVNNGSHSNNSDCEDGDKLYSLRGKGDKPLVNNPGQSKLLRELGIRVSRYTHEERRDIILKYMQKRSIRQVVNRTTKIPSRQALAERRLRGIGGKFLSKEEIQVEVIFVVE